MNLVLHTAAGAAIGRYAPTDAAFVSGMASHVALDLVRHEDLPLRRRQLGLEMLLSAAVVALIGLRFGWRSRPVAGALGGVLPDAEHLLGQMSDRRYQAVFPTHVWHGRFHNLVGWIRIPDAAQTAAGLLLLMATLLA